MFGLDRLELDGDLFARDDIDSEVDITYYFTEGKWAVRYISLVIDVARTWHVPKEPEPIFLPSLYFPPTRRSSLWEEVSVIWWCHRVPKVGSGGAGVSDGSKEKWRKESKGGRG